MARAAAGPAGAGSYSISKGPGEDIEATVGVWLGESDFLNEHLEGGEDPEVVSMFAMSFQNLIKMGKALGHPRWTQQGAIGMWVPDPEPDGGFIPWLEGYWQREFPPWLQKYRESRENKRKRNARYKAKKRAKKENASS